MTNEQLDECLAVARAGSFMNGAPLIEALEELKRAREALAKVRAVLADPQGQRCDPGNSTD